MENQQILQLPSNTTRLISSTQVITSVSSVVKELVENSLDAGAKNIQVKLENYGLDLIEVKDDGHGIDYSNVVKMFLSGFTSKIQEFNDIYHLHTYGFRGEALSAICKVGETTVTTKIDKDALAMTYSIDQNGAVTGSKPSHIPKGTIISVGKLFHSLPVRKQYASSKKKMAEELKKVESIVQQLSVVLPSVRVALIHNKSTIWQKNSVNNLKQSFMQVVGLRATSKMEYVKEQKPEATFELLIPKKELQELDGLFSTANAVSTVHVNNRPVQFKEITKIIMEHITHHFKDLPTNRQVICLVSIKVAPDEIDVNLEPNKTRILLKNLTSITQSLSEVLDNYFGHHLTSSPVRELENLEIDDLQEEIGEEIPNKRQKMDDEINKKQKAGREWSLTVINENQIETSNQVLEVIPSTLDVVNSICSQVNKNNCTLMTEKEVSELNDIMSTNVNKLVTNIPKIHKAEEDKQDKMETIDSSKQNSTVYSQSVLNGPLSDVPSSVACNYLTDNLFDNHQQTSRDEGFEFRFGSKETGNTENRTVEPINFNISFQEETFTTNEQLGAERVNNIDLDLPYNKNVTIRDNSFGTFTDKNRIELDKNLSPLFNTTNHSSIFIEKSNEAAIEILATNENSRVNNLNDMAAYEMSTVQDESTLEKHLPQQMNVMDWSRGRVQLNNGETLLGGSAVLVNPTMKDDLEKFNLSLDSISSQMGNKEMSAFTKFARIIRPKIIAENPGILFTDVSKKLVERWQCLSPQEQEYYEAMAKVVDVERKIHNLKKDSKVSVPQPKKGTIKNALQKSGNKLVVRPERGKTELSISLRQIMNLRDQPSNNDDSIRLVGKINEGKDYLYYKRGEIGHVRVKGLRELVLYQKMMSNLEISRKKLVRHELLSESVLGKELWTILISLPSEYDEESCKNIIDSNFITKNGFKVEIFPTCEQMPESAILTEVADNIPDFGLNDLKEVLQLYNWHGETSALPDLRPNRVKNYIKEEVIRIVNQNPVPPSSEDVTDLLNTWHLCLKHLPATCLHNRDVFVPIYSDNNQLNK